MYLLLVYCYFNIFSEIVLELLFKCAMYLFTSGASWSQTISGKGRGVYVCVCVLVCEEI